MRITSMTWLFVLALPVAAHAQETTGTGTTTGSGSVIERTGAEIFADILEAGAGRPVKLTQVQPTEKIRTAWEKESASIRERVATERSECREAVRRANRDQRLGKIFQCERALLMLETNLLRKESTYTAASYVDPVTLGAYQTATENLISAMMTIVDGIDAGLFTSEEQLMTARTNLRDTYRVPYRTEKARVRVDRELTYINFMTKQLSVRTDTSTPSLTTIATCLEESWELFEMAKTASLSDEKAAHLLAARSQTASCQVQIRTLAKADRQAASTVEN